MTVNYPGWRGLGGDVQVGSGEEGSHMGKEKRHRLGFCPVQGKWHCSHYLGELPSVNRIWDGKSQEVAELERAL